MDKLAIEFKAKETYAPLLGRVPFSRTLGESGLAGGFSAVPLTEEQQPKLVMDIMSRTGLLAEQIKSARYIGGLEKPDVYLKAKQEDINRIGIRLTREYVEEFERFIKNGMSNDKADARAMEYIKTRRKVLMKLHEDEYPLELTKKVFNKIGWGKKGGAGAGVIDKDKEDI